MEVSERWRDDRPEQAPWEFVIGDGSEGAANPWVWGFRIIGVGPDSVSFTFLENLKGAVAIVSHRQRLEAHDRGREHTHTRVVFRNHPDGAVKADGAGGRSERC